jgi:hypothetical protein
MKTRPLIVSSVLVGFTILFALSLSGKEAEVKWKKTDKSVEYTVSFAKDFKLNKDAPFKFFLKDKEENDIEKVAWHSFKKGKDGKYRYVSKKGEKKTNYWFVACKYADGKIIACKTFSEKFEIK